MPFISFLCFTALAKIYGTVLKTSGEKGYPCLVLDFVEEASRISPLSRISVVGFCRFIFWINLNMFPSIPNLSRGFFFF